MLVELRERSVGLQVKYDDGESLDHLLEAQHWKVKVVKHAPATA